MDLEIKDQIDKIIQNVVLDDNQGIVLAVLILEDIGLLFVNTIKYGVINVLTLASNCDPSCLDNLVVFDKHDSGLFILRGFV